MLDPHFDTMISQVLQQIPDYASYAMYGMLLVAFVIACASIGRTAEPRGAPPKAKPMEGGSEPPTGNNDP